jgi:HSP20 family protein
LDRFFNDTFETTNGSGFVPAVDISETDKSFNLEFAAPGFKKEDFTVDFNEGQLTVSGERKFENEQKDVNYHTRETRYGTFSRTFHLPENINDKGIKASYTDGILNVTLPKDEKKDLNRTIKIN